MIVVQRSCQCIIISCTDILPISILQNRCIAHLVAPLMVFLKTMYRRPDMSEATFMVPERSISYIGKNNRPMSRVAAAGLISMCKTFLKVADRELGERWATMPDVFMVAVALSPFMTTQIAFHKDNNMVERTRALFGNRLREVIMAVDKEEKNNAAVEKRGKELLRAKGGNISVMKNKGMKPNSARARSMMMAASAGSGVAGKRKPGMSKGGDDGPKRQCQEEDGMGGDLFLQMMGGQVTSTEIKMQSQMSALMARAKGEMAFLESSRVVKPHTGEDIIKFYNDNREKIPNLHLLFRATYPARGTEAAVESVFSYAGMQWNKKRGLLLPVRGGAMMMIHQNRRFCPTVEQVRKKYNYIRAIGL